MKRLGVTLPLALLALFVGCTDDLPIPAGWFDGGTMESDAGVDDAGFTFFTCPLPEGQDAPSTLECTGLYENFEQKTIAPGAREFEPAFKLWSDGASKRRWIELPPGTKIDNSNPSDWKFPVGTKFWKEFSHNGKRMETRLWIKTKPDWWVDATYKWVDNETRTQRSYGEEVPVEGGTYVIPTRQQCTDCHKGRSDNVLGFEQVLLGLPQATGVTLATLANEGLLTTPLAKTSYEMPDDGTGELGKRVIPWLHVNCGVSCHSELPRAWNPFVVYLRIYPPELEGRPMEEWSIIKQTLNVDAKAPHFQGLVRIKPGSPEDSLLFRLASNRGQPQMPPIATRIIDQTAIEDLYAWIEARGALEPQSDAGMPDGGADAGQLPPAGDPDASLPVPDAATQADGGVANGAQDAAVGTGPTALDAAP